MKSTRAVITLSLCVLLLLVLPDVTQAAQTPWKNSKKNNKSASNTTTRRSSVISPENPPPGVRVIRNPGPKDCPPSTIPGHVIDVVYEIEGTSIDPKYRNVRDFRSQSPARHSSPLPSSAYLNSWIVDFDAERVPSDVNEWAGQFGLKFHVFAEGQSRGIVVPVDDEALLKMDTDGMTKLLYTQPGVTLVSRSLDQKLAFKAGKDSPYSPLMSNQWHLHNDGSLPGALKYFDLNPGPAWEKYDGSGVMISVVDSGVDYNNTDVKDRYDASLSRDWANGDNDPLPEGDIDGHGTSCAGLAVGGSGDGKCGVGLAYNAPWSAQTIGSSAAPGFDHLAGGGMALGHEQDKIDIYTNSWGNDDDGEFHPSRAATENALDAGVETGRGGKGNIFVFANGNGKVIDSGNFDATARSYGTIAVSALDGRGKSALTNAEMGSNVLVCAFSNYVAYDPSLADNHNPVRIHTSGLTFDSEGDPADGDCDDSFGGTSAATPEVAGGIALMLQANPELGWRDVQWIIVLTAQKVDDANVAGQNFPLAGDFYTVPATPFAMTDVLGQNIRGWQDNGAGLPWHALYGYGRFDIGTAVELAEDWEPVGALDYDGDEATFSAITLANAPSCNTLFLSDSPDHVIENVLVSMELTGRLRDVSARLTSPRGTVADLFLHDNGNTGAGDIFLDDGEYFKATAFWGEPADDPDNNGWKLCLDDFDESLDDVEWTYWAVSTIITEKKGSLAGDGIRKRESNRPRPGCGNGVVEDDEECDGWNLPTERCGQFCTLCENGGWCGPRIRFGLWIFGAATVVGGGAGAAAYNQRRRKRRGSKKSQGDDDDETALGKPSGGAPYQTDVMNDYDGKTVIPDGESVAVSGGGLLKPSATRPNRDRSKSTKSKKSKKSKSSKSRKSKSSKNSRGRSRSNKLSVSGSRSGSKSRDGRSKGSKGSRGSGGRRGSSHSRNSRNSRGSGGRRGSGGSRNSRNSRNSGGSRGSRNSLYQSGDSDVGLGH